ncbi:hypothetical protein DTO027I6_9942 [Penicillium roqueforti]|nr:hypothetical protein CBS147337_10064 [Penicillium roqueforti]KAI3184703.1 hypothetical protein DTO027I6_9942 [Penicillium roqueforti]
MHFVAPFAYSTLILGAIANAAEVGESGQLSSLMGDLQGNVVIKDDNTIVVEGFELQKLGGPPLNWYGSLKDDIPHGFRISEGEVADVQKTPKDLTVKLDAGKSLSDFEYVGLWCEPYKINFGQTKLSKDRGSSSSSNSTASSDVSTSVSSASPTAASSTTGSSDGSSVKSGGFYLAAISLVASTLLI